MFNFKLPYMLLLIPIVSYLFLKKKASAAIKVPGIQFIKNYSRASRKHLIGKSLIFLATIFMIFALARPQVINEGKVIKKDGIDIVISLDLSKSMEIRDFSPNRLEKSKELLNIFIDKRFDDRISLVVFGGEAYTKIPLTFDHNILKNMISTITTDDISSNNRTAIGMGLGVALNRLKDSDSKSKIVILITDGENNSGEMTPLGAAKIAKELGIKVYTIGIGAKEVPVSGFFGTSYVENTMLDETLLKKIATETNGKYFRASDPKVFQNIFNQINNLEKTEMDSRSVYDAKEYFEELLKIALILMLLGIFFEYFKYIRIP